MIQENVTFYVYFETNEEKHIVTLNSNEAKFSKYLIYTYKYTLWVSFISQQKYLLFTSERIFRGTGECSLIFSANAVNAYMNPEVEVKYGNGQIQSLMQIP